MTDTSSAPHFQTARRLALALIVVTILLCCAIAVGVVRFVNLFEEEKAAQKTHQEKLQAVMLIQSSVMDLQGYVLGGDTRLAGRLSDEASDFETLQRNHSSDKDFQQLNEAFHMWHQTLAQPMVQKRHEFDTSSLNFSEMGIAYIKGNAPMHERRLAELSAQALNASKEDLDAVHSRIAGMLYPSIAITALFGISTLALALILSKSVR
jgi:hypothetical protein